MVTEPIPNGGEDVRPPKATAAEIAAAEAEDEPPLRVGKTSITQAASGGIGKMALVSFVVAFLVILGMGIMGGGSFVTKNDFETNLANMTVTLQQATGDLGQARETVNNAVQGIPSMVSSQINNAISQAVSQLTTQMADVSSKVDIATSTVNTMNQTVTALTAQVAVLEARLAALETDEQTTQEAETNADALEISMGFSSSFVYPNSQTASGDKTLFFQVENTLSQDVENVNIELVIHSRGVPINLAPSLCSVSGGWPLQWQKLHVGNGFMVLQGITPIYGGGLEIESNEDEDVFLTINLGTLVADAPTQDVTFYVEAKVTEYDVVP